MTKILAIETSCDETSASVVENGRSVLSNCVFSQISIHKPYGGVVPEIASRNHVDKLKEVIDQALNDANLTLSGVDAIACTYGAGLVGALITGVSYAKGISYATDKPLIGANHIEGHMCANLIAHPELEPPFICLIASGGHSHIVNVIDYCKYELIGATVDDAAGEAFDKAARALGLSYPGGPALEELAKTGNPKAYSFSGSFNAGAHFDFSFSGLKTAVINTLHNGAQHGVNICHEDIAASFQYEVCNILSTKTIRAALKHNIFKVALAGGVAANKTLRNFMQEKCDQAGLSFYCPPIELCTDNAAMISSAAYYHFIAGERADLSLNAKPQLDLC